MKGRFWLVIATMAVALSACSGGTSSSTTSTTSAGSGSRSGSGSSPTTTSGSSRGSTPGSTAASSGSQIYTQQGNGYANTSSFTVPSGPSGWVLQWSYACPAGGTVTTGPGSIGYFVVAAFKGSKEDTKDSPVVGTALSGSGSKTYTDTGTFSLHIGAQNPCNWTVTVNAG